MNNNETQEVPQWCIELTRKLKKNGTFEKTLKFLKTPQAKLKNPLLYREAVANE